MPRFPDRLVSPNEVDRVDHLTAQGLDRHAAIAQVVSERIGPAAAIENPPPAHNVPGGHAPPAPTNGDFETHSITVPLGTDMAALRLAVMSGVFALGAAPAVETAPADDEQVETAPA